VYGLLISEDNALLLGSVLLFAMLAGVMYVTRRVDWYRGSEELVEVRGSSPAHEGVPIQQATAAPSPPPPRSPGTAG